jgi:DNA-binding NarL/FixJ family response regulator
VTNLKTLLHQESDLYQSIPGDAADVPPVILFNESLNQKNRMIRILIADDHAVVRKGLKQILIEEYPSAKIGEVADAESLLAEVMNGGWDIVLCDMNMPGRSGLDALTQIKQVAPHLPVLIMSMYPEDQYALRVLKAGASGYLGKDNIHEDIIKAIQTVQLGKKFITPTIAEQLANALGEDSGSQPHEHLSDREFDVFKLLASGKAVSDIAAQLSLSATTVSTYRSRIMEKMNMRTNAELTRYALENKLI